MPLNLVGFPVIFVVLVVVFFLKQWVHILKEYERAVIFRLGRLLPQPKGPGWVFIFWPNGFHPLSVISVFGVAWFIRHGYHLTE